MISFFFSHEFKSFSFHLPIFRTINFSFFPTRWEKCRNRNFNVLLMSCAININARGKKWPTDSKKKRIFEGNKLWTYQYAFSCESSNFLIAQILFRKPEMDTGKAFHLGNYFYGNRSVKSFELFKNDRRFTRDFFCRLQLELMS